MNAVPHGMRVRTQRRQDGGAALVEAALVIPVVLLVVLAVFELGMMFKSATVASSASRAGARLASATYASTSPTTVVGAPVGTAVRSGVPALVAGAVTEALRDRNSGDTPVALRIYRVAVERHAGGRRLQRLRHRLLPVQLERHRLDAGRGFVERPGRVRSRTSTTSASG